MFDIAEDIEKETVKIESEIRKMEKIIVFGEFRQYNNVTLEEETYDGENTESKVYNGIYVETKRRHKIKVADIIINSVTIYSDDLGLSKDKIDIEYENLLFGKTESLCNCSKRELEAHFIENFAFVDEKYIKPVIQSIIHYWENKNVENGVFVDGFIYHNGKIIDNTANKDLEYSNDDVANAIELVNDVISNRDSAKPNDATLLRFMLCSPFMYCMKQIGYGDSNYGLILYGKPQTSKTGSVSIFSWLYSTPAEIYNPISTMSVYGEVIQSSTLPSLFDEAYSFLKNTDNHDPIKNGIFGFSTRQARSLTNTGEIVDYKALSIPIFTYNEDWKVPPYFDRRFHLCFYDETMVISDEDRIAFDYKYIISNPESPLKQLRYLGKAFSDKIIPYFENKDKRVMEIEKLTVNILKEIADEVGVEFDSEIYTIQDSNKETVLDLKSEIKIKLNELFRKRHFKHSQFTEYRKVDFIGCANNGEIPFLFYKERKKEFVIQKKSFVSTVSELVGQRLSLEEIAKYLEIDVSDIKAHKVKGINRGDCFVISPKELELKIFNIKPSDRDIEEYEETIWWFELNKDEKMVKDFVKVE
ncbi:hypothetical protein [Methanobrevibacter sp.]|uniref:hypothetical protein n=1 Tax=Methanobrevibacter sp. TaxID=66852 RepID=UPI003862DB8F